MAPTAHSPAHSSPSAAPFSCTALLNALPWGVLVLDADEVIRYINPMAARWWQGAPDTLLGQPFAQGALPPALAAALRQLLAAGEAPPEVWLPHARQWVSLRLGPAPVGQRWVFGEDVTDRHRAEDTQQRSGQLLLDMEAVAHTGSYEADLTTGAFYFSDGLFRLFGEEPQAFVPTLELLDARSHPADAAAVRQVLDQAVAARQPYTYHRRIRRADGQWRTLEAHGEVLCDAAGTPFKLRGLVQDVTERVQAEQALQHSQDLLRRTIDSSQELVQVFEAVRDEQGQVVDFRWVLNNAAAEQVYGNVIGQRLCEHNPGVIEEGIFDTFRQVVETGVPAQDERHYQHEQFNGWFHQSVVKLGDGVATTTRTITAHKQAEQALRQSQRLLQDVIDAPHIGIAVYRAVRNAAGTVVDFRHEYLNQASRNMLGEDFTGRLFTDHGENARVQLPQFLQALETGQRNSYVRAADFRGRQMWFAITNTPLDGDRLVHTWEDVTERQQAQQQILQLQEELAQRLTNKYHALFHSMDQGFAVLEVQFEEAGGHAVDFRYQELNPVFVRESGMPEGAQGRTARELLPDLEPFWFESYGRVARTGEPLRVEHYVPTVDRWFDVHAFRVGLPEAHQVAVLFNDITERKRRETNATLLVAISEDLNRLSGEEEMLAAVGARLTRHLDLAGWHYVDVDEERAEVTLRHCWHAQDVPSVLGTYPIAGFLSPDAVARLRDGTPSVVADVQTDLPSDSEAGAALKAGAAAQHIAAYIAVPYSVGGQWKAYFALVDSRPRAWTAAETALVQDVAARVFPRIARARTEDALRESEARFRAVANLVPDLLWRSTPDSNTTWYNQRWYEYTGQTPAAAAGYGWTAAIHSDDRATSSRGYRAAIAAGKPLQQEHRIRSAQGEYRWFQVQARPLLNEHGTVVAWYGAATDIHARKLAEQHLQENLEQLRLATKAAQAGWGYCSFLTGEVSWDEAGQRILGFPTEADSRTIDGWRQRLHPDDRPAVEARLAACMREHQPFDLEYRVVRADQQVRFIHAMGGFRYAEDGTLEQGGGLVIDVTVRKEAEQALQYMNSLLRAMIDHSLLYLQLFKAVRDEQGAIVDFEWLLTNQRWNEQWGEMRGQRLLAHNPAVVETGLFEKFKRVTETGVADTHEHHYAHEQFDGWFWQTAAKVNDGFLLSTLDITARKQAEEALQASEARFRALFAASPVPFLVLSPNAPDYTITAANDAYVAATLTTPERLLGHRLFDVFPDDPARPGQLGSEALAVSLERVLRTRQPDVMPRVRYGLVVPGGYEPHWWEALNAPVLDVAGQVTAIIHQVHRVTELHQAEAAERERQAAQTFLLRFSDVLRTEPTVDAVAHRALALLLEQLGLDRCYMAEYQLADDHADITHQTGNDRVPPLPAGGIRLSDFPEAFRVVFDRTLVIDDFAATEGLSDTDRHNIGALGLRALVAATLRRGENTPHWVMVAVSAVPRRWTAGEVALLEEVTERTWVALERARAEAALAASEEKYRTLFETMDEGFALCGVVRDAAGQVVDFVYQELNQALEQQTGLDRQRLTGQHLSAVLPPADLHRWVRIYADVVDSGVPRTFEEYTELLDRWFVVSVYPNDGDQLAIFYRDITERKRREANLAFLADVSEDLVRLTDLDNTMNALGGKLGTHLGLSACAFAELVDGAQVGVIRHEWQLPGHPSLLGTYRMAEFVAPEVLRRCQAGQPVVVRDVWADPLTDGAQYAALQVGSFVSMPLVREGEWRFLLVVYRPAPHDWTADEVNLLREVTGRIWTRLERARAEEALRTSEAKYRTLFESIDEGFCLIELLFDEQGTAVDYRFVEVNPAFERQTGLSHVPGRLGSELTPGTEPYWLETYGRVARTGVPIRVENYHAGTGRWYDASASRVEGGGRHQVVIVFNDITARKLAEDALRRSQAQLADLNDQLEQRVVRRTQALQASRDLLQSVFDTNLIAMSVLEAVRDESGIIQDFRLVLVSQELVRETGRTDLVGKLYGQQYPGIREVGIFDLIVRAVETGQPQGMEYFYPHEGFDKWFACQFVKLGDGVVATNLDITERKTAEQERLKNLHLLEQAEAVAGLGSWDYDLATGSMRWSDGMYHLFGLPVGSTVKPQHYLDAVLPADRPRAKQLVRRMLAGEDFEETLRLQVGERVKTVRLKAMVLRDAAGQPARVLGVDLDISELQRLEADNLRLRLTQQQALFEAVQAAQEAERKRVAEGLHNGIGQILYATKLRLDRLHTPLLGTAPALVAARREADQLLADAIRQTRALSHELVPMVLEEFGLAAALQDIARKMSTPQLHLHSHVVLDEAAGPLPPALQLALYRMAQELAQNVMKHAQGATAATLELETMPGWVLLRVEDDGLGFTAAPASGPGLGLCSIRDRVALLGGQLETGDADTGGAYVRIRIPIPAPAPAQ